MLVSLHFLINKTREKSNPGKNIKSTIYRNTIPTIRHIFNCFSLIIIFPPFTDTEIFSRAIKITYIFKYVFLIVINKFYVNIFWLCLINLILFHFVLYFVILLLLIGEIYYSL